MTQSFRCPPIPSGLSRRSALSRLCALLLLLVMTGLPVSQAAAAPNVEGARNFIADLGRRTVEVLQQKNLSQRQVNDRFRALFRQGFDIPTIGRFVLGVYWREATPQQQQEYLRLFEDMVVYTYARRFNEYSGEMLRVTGARAESDRDVMVDSQIQRPNGPPVNVTWRVRDRGNNNYQIVDVMVEGVSMGVTQRNEFASILQRNGGNMNALFDAMRNVIANNEQPS